MEEAVFKVFEKNDSLETIKAQLRCEIVKRLMKDGQKVDLKQEFKRNELVDTLVASYLKDTNCLLTLSVFVPESRTSVIPHEYLCNLLNVSEQEISTKTTLEVIVNRNKKFTELQGNRKPFHNPLDKNKVHIQDSNSFRHSEQDINRLIAKKLELDLRLKELDIKLKSQICEKENIDYDDYKTQVSNLIKKKEIAKFKAKTLELREEIGIEKGLLEKQRQELEKKQFAFEEEKYQFHAQSRQDVETFLKDREKIKASLKEKADMLASALLTVENAERNLIRRKKVFENNRIELLRWLEEEKQGLIDEFEVRLKNKDKELQEKQDEINAFEYRLQHCKSSANEKQESDIVAKKPPKQGQVSDYDTEYTLFKQRLYQKMKRTYPAKHGIQRVSRETVILEPSQIKKISTIPGICQNRERCSENAANIQKPLLDLNEKEELPTSIRTETQNVLNSDDPTYNATIEVVEKCKAPDLALLKDQNLTTNLDRCEEQTVKNEPKIDPSPGPTQRVSKEESLDTPVLKDKFQAEGVSEELEKTVDDGEDSWF